MGQDSRAGSVWLGMGARSGWRDCRFGGCRLARFDGQGMRLLGSPENFSSSVGSA